MKYPSSEIPGVPGSVLGSETLAKIIDGSPIASFVIDRGCRVVYWNRAIEALSGISRDEIIGTGDQWRAFYAARRPVMADLIVEGASPATIESYYKGKCRKSPLIDGAFEAEDYFPELGEDGKWLHFTASPIADDSGETIGAIETLEDITERKLAEQSLLESEKDLRHYLQQITRAEEEERKRIARELHDDTAQVLGSLSRQLDNFLRRKSGLAPREVLFFRDLQAQLNRGLVSLHRFIHDLRPPVLDDLGLVPALRSLAKGIQDSDGVTVDIAVVGEERRLPPDSELMLWRIVQEALNNVRKHARATQAKVTMEFGAERVRVTVSDNGRGFERPAKLDDLTRTGKLGLAGMQERARLMGGTLDIASTPGRGTTVFVEAPA